MSEIVILNRVRFHERPDLTALEKYHEESGQALSEVAGYKGAQIWVDLLDPHSFLTAHVYEDLSAAERALHTFAEESLVQEYLKLGHDLPYTTRVRVVEAEGLLDGNLTDAELISMSVRIAVPGLSNELRDDLRRVFSECAMIPGFTGYLIGVNDSLEEETIGLASWDNEGAFLQSLPEGIIVKVRCFARAFHRSSPTHAVVMMDRQRSAEPTASH